MQNLICPSYKTQSKSQYQQPPIQQKHHASGASWCLLRPIYTTSAQFVCKPLTPTLFLLLLFRRNIHRQRPPKSTSCPSRNWKQASRTPSTCLRRGPSPAKRPLLGHLPAYLTSLAQPGPLRASVSRPFARMNTSHPRCVLSSTYSIDQRCWSGRIIARRMSGRRAHGNLSNCRSSVPCACGRLRCRGDGL